ncbi:hypothetical protein BN946_scf185002.g18 [Trametes cinnabarina]|uniref:Uncharacterized protein n=1 Tax=Pycnoporus cinnabarinus TaxID=5643 RepID=A0A060SKA5_PYCCI|nr:hypothetical protein BN946_scf185002.g18 [Trametes cinnabarina]
MAHEGLQFSWSDSCRAALSSCLPCLRSSDAPSDSEYENENANVRRNNHRQGLNGALAHVVIPPPRARPDELEGLLADASDDAETLSLHSNIGDRSRRRGRGPKNKKKRHRDGGPKHIRVFGFDLFGRAPAIQLPESDDETPGAGVGGSARPRPRTISTDTLDSDAAPLDVSAIQELSAARQAEARAREEEERRAKEEQRRRRREKRALKRAAMAHALELHAGANEEFEGFQGSGPAFDQAFSPSLGSGSGSMSVSDSQEFGPFAQGQLAQPFDADAALAAEEDGDGADFGGESYTHRPRKSKSGRVGGSGTQTTSDTRSSSSRSYSFSYSNGTGPAPYNHQFLAQQTTLPRSPLAPLSPDIDSVPPSPTPAPNGAKKHRRKSTRSKAPSVATAGTASVSSNVSSQSATASQTASLISPPQSDAPDAAPGRPRIFAPSHGLGFEGIPDGFGEHAHEDVQERHAPVHRAVFDGGDGGFAEDADEEAEVEAERVRKERPRAAEPLAVASFPSVGLRGVQRTKSDMGVFLARRATSEDT